MVNVAVVEDDEAYASQIIKMLGKLGEEIKQQLKTSYFDSAVSLLQQGEKNLILFFLILKCQK